MRDSGDKGEFRARHIRVLLLEDNPDDAELVRWELGRAGLSVALDRVASRDAFVAHLGKGGFDIILADFRLPGFDGLDALRVAQDVVPEIPFVIVTGSLDEETAVECMKAGAWDYVIKDHLVRLAPSVQSALDRGRTEAARRAAEARLHRSERRFRSLIENAPDLIAVLDAQGTVLYASPSVARLLSSTPEEFVGSNAFEAIHPDDQAALSRGLSRLMAEPGRIETGVFHFRGPDGDYRMLECTVRNLLDNPDVAGLVVNARDVTEHKALEESFFKAQKMEALGRLAGGLAHDFNNILTAILGNVELLLMRASPGTEEQRLAQAIQEAAESGARVSRQLTAFAKGQVVKPVNLDLRYSVQVVARTLLPILGEDIRLDMEFDEVPTVVRIDPGQFEQVLINLAINARDAMPGGGSLRLSVARRPGDDGSDQVELAVSDTGKGMESEVIEQIFDPFYTTKQRGTGIGLYTVRSIVESHGGTVEVESRIGEGTTFRIRWPARKDVAVESSRQIQSPRSKGLPKGSETILVVEDEPAVLKFAIRALTSLGYNVLWATNANDARKKIEIGAGEIDVLLTDVVLPGERSPDLAKSLVQANPGARVVFMSGYTAQDLWHVTEGEPTSEFIQKPFTMAQLALKLRRVIDGPHRAVG